MRFKVLKKVLAVLISLIVFATPAMAATITATQLKPAPMNVKELDKNNSNYTQMFKNLSEHKDLTKLKNSVLTGKVVLEGEHLLQTIDPADNKPIQVLVIPFVQNNKPGIIGIASKDGNTLVEAIQLESSDETTIGIKTSVLTTDKTIHSEITKFNKNKSLASSLIKPAYADAYSTCVDFCNLMCSTGAGYSCWAGCAGFTGPFSIVLCPAICGGFSWAVCSYGCPWYCTNVIGV